MHLCMYVCYMKRYFKIDHLARHFVYYIECLVSQPSLSMQSKKYPFILFNDLHSSGKRVGILANCENLIYYSCSRRTISFVKYID